MIFIQRLRYLGPGILTASAAIGTSHFVQSIRAGGYFGYELLWVILAVNILKYPFIEYGFRYTAATKENLLSGYKKLNPKMFYLFLAINVILSMAGIAVLSYICSGVLKSIFYLPYSIKHISVFIFLISWFIIAFGHYKYLDKLMKIFMLLLLLTTIAVVILAMINYTPSASQYYNDSAWNPKYIPFIIALMGWMPGPMELSVWHSLWLEAQNREKIKLDFEKAKYDFNVSYFLMIITAVLFLSIGALIIHNSNTPISDNTAIYSSQLISSYTSVIGDWVSIIISASVFAAIFSTTLTLIDAYPRTLATGWTIIKRNTEDHYRQKIHSRLILLSCIGSFFIISYVSNFKILIDTVTTIAFLTGPLFAWMNYKLVYSDLVDETYKPSKYMKFLSIIGFVYFFCFIMLFAWSKIQINF